MSTSTPVDKMKVTLLLAFRLTVFTVVLYLGAQKQFVTLSHFDGTERANNEVIKRLEQALSTNQDSITQLRRIAERLEDKMDRLIERRAAAAPQPEWPNMGFPGIAPGGTVEVFGQQIDNIKQ